MLKCLKTVSKYSKSVKILQQYPPSFWWSDAPKTRWPECHLTQMSRAVTPLSGPSQRSTDYRAISCQPLSNHLSICSTLVISPKRFPPLPQSQPKMVGQEEEDNTCCRYAGSAGAYLGISFILSRDNNSVWWIEGRWGVSLSHFQFWCFNLPIYFNLNQMKVQLWFKSNYLFLLFNLKVNSRAVIEVSDRIWVDTRAKKSTKQKVNSGWHLRQTWSLMHKLIRFFSCW